MTEQASPGMTAAHGRRFGLTVGGAFLVFAGIAWWRDHAAVAQALGALGALLATAAALVPTRLGPVERAWMRLAHAISKVTTPIVMGLMYLLVVTPVGIARRTLGGNQLRHEVGGHGFWKERPAGRRRTANMTRQF